jgi:hypothetical protein
MKHGTTLKDRAELSGKRGHRNSSYSEMTFENGELIRQEVHVPADVRFIDSVDPNDVVK